MTNDQFTILYDEVKGIKNLLTGNGSPEKGVIVRLDRVEVKMKRADWVMKAIFCAIAAGIAGLVADLVLKVI